MHDQIETQETQVVENTQQPIINEQEKQPEESIQDRNWKKFREERAIERKQKEEAEKRAIDKEREAEALKAAMDAILNKPQSHNQSAQSYDEEETEEQKIDKRVNAILESRRQKEYEETARKEQQELPQRLTQAYSDFNDICTSDNLDYLEYHHPEIAEAFKNSPDSFSKWAAIYKVVKKYVPNTDSKKDQKRAENNFSKPQSMSVAGKTQTGDSAPVMLDDKRRSDNWKRMQQVMKGGR